jgi:hypothetical protein
MLFTVIASAAKQSPGPSTKYRKIAASLALLATTSLSKCNWLPDETGHMVFDTITIMV